MRAAIVSIGIIVAAVVGGFIGHSIRTAGGPGPIDDHNPVGFNLSTASPAPNATSAPLAITSSNSKQGCLGTNVRCYITIKYVRPSPLPCTLGDQDDSCAAPTCPPQGECYQFSGPVSITHIDSRLRHHNPDWPNVQGIIVLQSPPSH